MQRKSLMENHLIAGGIISRKEKAIWTSCTRNLQTQGGFEFADEFLKGREGTFAQVKEVFAFVDSIMTNV